MKNVSVSQLVELAREVEVGDPIDWGMLSMREEDAYWLMANQVLEMFANIEDPDERYLSALAVSTKLIVENFVLNTRMLEMVKTK